MLSPDKTPMANEMHVELGTLRPFTEVQFLEIPMQNIEKTSLIKRLFLGESLERKRVPIISFEETIEGINYSLYDSEKKDLGGVRSFLTPMLLVFIIGVNMWHPTNAFLL